jgi:hypothetical protein
MGDGTSLAWLAPVLSCEMMSKESLTEAPESEGWPQSEMPSVAMAYLLFKLGEPMAVPSRDVTGLVPASGFHAVSKTLNDLGNCVMAV